MTRGEILEQLYQRMARASKVASILNPELLSTSQLNELKELTVTLYDVLRFVGAYLEELEKEK